MVAIQSGQDVLPLSPGQRRLAYAVVLLAAVGGTLVFSVLMPLLPAMAQAFAVGGRGELSAQMTMMMPSLGYLICGPLSGWVLARIRLRVAIIASLLVIGLCGASAGVITGLVGLSVTRFATGFGGAMLTVSAMTLLAACYDETARSRMIGYYSAVTSAGTLPIAFLSGAIAQGYGWRASFTLYLVFGLGGVVLALVGVPSMPAISRTPSVTSVRSRGMSSLLPILLVVFLLQIPTIMPLVQFPFVLARLGVHDPRVLSLIMGGASLVTAGAAVVSGYGQARFGAWPVILCGLVLVAIGDVGVGLSADWRIASIANLVGLVGSALYMPQFYTLPLAYAAPSQRAGAVGLAQSAMALSAACNPFMLAPLTTGFGLMGMYIAVGVIALIAVLMGSAAVFWRRPSH